LKCNAQNITHHLIQSRMLTSPVEILMKEKLKSFRDITSIKSILSISQKTKVLKIKTFTNSGSHRLMLHVSMKTSLWFFVPQNQMQDTLMSIKRTSISSKLMKPIWKFTLFMSWLLVTTIEMVPSLSTKWAKFGQFIKKISTFSNVLTKRNLSSINLAWTQERIMYFILLIKETIMENSLTFNSVYGTLIF